MNQAYFSGLVRLGLVIALGVALDVGASDAKVDMQTLRRSFDSLLARFDRPQPGRGTTDYPGRAVADVPKGYAMLLKAALIQGGHGDARLARLQRRAARYLMRHSDERVDGFPGWGVPVSWDAYGDGSENPAHTKYTISTAIVVDALLDWLAADPDAPREQLLTLVRSALMPYTSPESLSPSGLLPYSLEPSDRPYDTFNPAAYLAGVMQRFAALEPDAEVAARMRATATRTVEVLLAQRQRTANGHWYWHYSISEPVPNDLAHAAYIVQGLELYARFDGALAPQFDLTAIAAHLSDFVDTESGRVLAWPNFRTDANNPARSYDLGMGMSLACRMPDAEVCTHYTQVLSTYRVPDGAYLKYPREAVTDNPSIREYEAYLLLGIATHLAASSR